MANVPVEEIRPFLEELIAAVGVDEAARRIGIATSNVWYIRTKARGVQNRTAAKILLAAWPHSTRARTRSAHDVIRSEDCIFPNCPREAMYEGYCSWHRDEARSVA